MEVAQYESDASDGEIIQEQRAVKENKRRREKKKTNPSQIFFSILMMNGSYHILAGMKVFDFILPQPIMR